MATAHYRMGPTEWALLLLLSLLWGSVFLLTKLALADMRPFTAVALRLGIGALILHGAVLITGATMPRSFQVWRPFLAMGALNNLLPFCLIDWGQTHIASGLAAVLNATTPLFTVLLAHVWTRDERLTATRLMGVVLGVAGVAIMIGPAAFGGLTDHVLGEVAILGAAICYACAGLFGRRFRGQPPLVTATGQVTASALMVLPLALFLDRPWAGAMPGMTAWAAVVAAATFSTAIGYVVYFHILSTAGATNLLLVTLIMPAMAALLGTVVLGEAMHTRDYVGMGIIGLGLLAIDGRAVSWLWIRRNAPRSETPAE